MKIQRSAQTAVPVLLALIVGTAPASAQTATEIMTKQKELLKTQDEYEVQNVVLVNAQGQKKERKVERLTKSDANNLNKILIRFLSPRDVEGTALLTWERKGGDDDQWLYLPAVGQPRRIPSSGKKNRFMGTDFSYEDLRPEALDSYSYKLVGNEACDGKPCYVIEAVPKTDKEKQDSGYSRRKFWILKDNYFPVKREFYDSAGAQEKIERSTGLQNVSGSVWRAGTIEMEDVKKHTKTILSVTGRKINQRLSDQLFTERELSGGQKIEIQETVEAPIPPARAEVKKPQEITKPKEAVSTAKANEAPPPAAAKPQVSAPPRLDVENPRIVAERQELERRRKAEESAKAELARFELEQNQLKAEEERLAKERVLADEARLEIERRRRTEEAAKAAEPQATAKLTLPTLPPRPLVLPTIAELPKYSVGDAWTVKFADGRTETRKVRGIEGGQYVFEWGLDLVRYFDRDLVLRRQITAEEGKEFPSLLLKQRLINFPLSAQKTWNFRVVVFRRSQGTEGIAIYYREFSFKVVGSEEVATPAGNFAAFKIEETSYESRCHIGPCETEPNTTVVRHWWYAPEVRFLVKVAHVRGRYIADQEPDYELTAFELK